MTTSQPFVLTNATRFPPIGVRGRSRSPSRSPIRKAQFAARELDPLLSNLSPDSTLKALQATATITSEERGQDALARSIAEATPAEREIGIRAAIAAQKLREWHTEVSRWPWPARRDRGWGAGFLPPPHKSADTADTSHDVLYLGFLPSLKVNAYRERIEDIRDGIEALELEDVKDHIFSAHVPQRSVSAPQSLGQSSSTQPAAYGRMRDFTALITATVIQALPELANLNILLDTWEIRFAVLRQIPEITHSFSSVRAGIQTAFSVVRSAETGPLVTMSEYEATKSILGGKVAALERKVDNLLDMLEGQDDSLPKIWIDTLEDIENEYAVWAVEAEHAAIRNNLLANALGGQSSSDDGNLNQAKALGTRRSLANSRNETKELRAVKVARHPKHHGAHNKGPLGSTIIHENSPSRKPVPQSGESKKPPLKIAMPAPRHHRGVSEISAADSTLSAVSGISSAEIVDAQSTQVLISPKISVVENPFRASRDELSLFSNFSPDANLSARPPMLQRASTAAIEVISRDSIKQVMLTRSRSHDILKQISPINPPATNPTQALQQLSGANTERASSLDGLPHEVANTKPGVNLVVPETTVSPSLSPTPSLRVEPLQIRNRNISNVDSESPALPRRSSKRLSQSFSTETDQTIDPAMVRVPEELEGGKGPIGINVPTTNRPNESLEAKIKDILETMPTKIRLAKSPEVVETPQVHSESSTRSSTPVPALTLAPVKVDRADRQVAAGDVRLFHLTRSGQPRDTPPVKLFVRAVGEHGERVMVRVGGGWADLAEYLREYSLHHGHRGLAQDGLEVANFPVPPTSQKESVVPNNNASAGSSKVTPTTASSTPQRNSFLDTALVPGELPALNIGKVRRNSRGPNITETPNRATVNQWTPPPVPPIPTTYTKQFPTTVTTTINGVTRTGTFDPINSSLLGNARAVSAPMTMSNASNALSPSTTTPIANPPPRSTGYVPLGAAGPVANDRRSTSYNTVASTDRESWVAGMMGKARAVSNSTTTTIQSPTITTTTTVFSRNTPRSKRASAVPSLGPVSAPINIPVSGPINASSNIPTASPAPLSSDSSGSKHSPPPTTRAKNRMSLGDVGGIRRVFLRRKSDKS